MNILYSTHKSAVKPDRCILCFTTWLETVLKYVVINNAERKARRDFVFLTAATTSWCPDPDTQCGRLCSQLLQARHTKRWGRPELSQLLKHYLRRSPLALFTRILNTYHLCLLLFLLPFLASLFVNFVVTLRVRSPSGILGQLRSTRHGLF